MHGTITLQCLWWLCCRAILGSSRKREDIISLVFDSVVTRRQAGPLGLSERPVHVDSPRLPADLPPAPLVLLAQSSPPPHHSRALPGPARLHLMSPSKTCQLNVGSLTGRCVELATMLHKRAVDIVCIQSFAGPVPSRALLASVSCCGGNSMSRSWTGSRLVGSAGSVTFSQVTPQALLTRCYS